MNQILSNLSVAHSLEQFHSKPLVLCCLFLYVNVSIRIGVFTAATDTKFSPSRIKVAFLLTNLNPDFTIEN